MRAGRSRGQRRCRCPASSAERHPGRCGWLGSTYAGQQAFHSSRNGIRDHASSLSFIASGGRMGEIAVLTASSNRSNSTSVIALSEFKRAAILTSRITIFPQIIDVRFGGWIESFCSLRRDGKKDRLCQKLFKQVPTGRSARTRLRAAASAKQDTAPPPPRGSDRSHHWPRGSRDLMDHFLMLDCQRPIMRSHFPVVLPGYWIGRFFCFLLERASTLGNFLCVRHLTPHAERGFP